jgi:hypothetical protein
MNLKSVLIEQNSGTIPLSMSLPGIPVHVLVRLNIHVLDCVHVHVLRGENSTVISVAEENKYKKGPLEQQNN